METIWIGFLLALCSLSSVLDAQVIKTDSRSPNLPDTQWASSFRREWKKRVEDNLIALKQDCTWLYAEWARSTVKINFPTGKGDSKKAYVGYLKDKPKFIGNCDNAPTAKGGKQGIKQLTSLNMTWNNIEMNSTTGDKQTIRLTAVVVSLTSTISRISGSWDIKDATVTLVGPNNLFPGGTAILPLRTEQMTAAYDLYRPDKFSFSCLDLKIKTQPFKPKGGEPLEPRTVIRLARFQLQPFTVEGKRFRTSFDCATWFTIPLWMGLITVVGFMTIVLIGAYLLSTIKVMDRFEDPKGKPLQIKAD